MSMQRKQVCGLENEYCLSLILDDGSFVHDGDEDISDWFWNQLVAASKCSAGASSPFTAFGAVREKCLPGFTPLRMWFSSTGGTLYEDYVHPGFIVEYATPECDAFENAVSAEKAGERILYCLSRFLCKKNLRYCDRDVRTTLFSKSNTNLISGVSLANAKFHGSHENYEMPLSFYIEGEGSFFETALASFLAARVLFSGAGGLIFSNGEWQYYISPRGSIARAITASQATHESRPLFTWKHDEGVAKNRMRLEVNVGDSNMHPQALRWRLGLMYAFLRLIKSPDICTMRLPLLEDPLDAIRRFSSDASLRATAALSDGRGKWTVVECMREWLAILQAHGEKPGAMPSAERHLVEGAHACVEESSGNPDAFSEITDWGLKRFLLEEYCRIKHLSFSDWKARRFTVYYSDVSPEGIFNTWWREKAKSDSSLHIPFSKEDMNELIWQNRVAPRAEFRKRHLYALYNASRHTNNDWGVFVLQNDREIKISDPMISSHSRVDADIKKLLNKSNKTIKKGRSFR